MHWDIFCRVIDNFGDVGVCWRLAADLASRGDFVRLWIDDRSALRWMAPGGAAGVEVCDWPAEEDTSIAPHEAVVEAFGCRLPSGFVRRMANRAPPPPWVNLEYLSAEDYVELNHGLPSPQAGGPGRGLAKWFFYPGFTNRTGGLLRERGLAERRRTFDAVAWRTLHGLFVAPEERCVSLFCYANAALPALVRALAGTPALLLATAGAVTDQLRTLAGSASRIGNLRFHYLPTLSQIEYDHLLWSCDFNLVRGEDSFVRAQWAGVPFLWNIYPQHDAAHLSKLAAFDALFLRSAPSGVRSAVENASLAWNAPVPPEEFPLPEPALWEAWREHCVYWRTHLEALPDLASSLRDFVRERR